MKKIQSKMKALELAQHCTSIFKHLRASTSIVGDGIWPKFKDIQALIVFLVIYKNEEDPLKNEDARVIISPFINLWEFFRSSSVAISADPDSILPNFKPI